MPVSTLSRVDLPAPFSPIRPTTSFSVGYAIETSFEGLHAGERLARRGFSSRTVGHGRYFTKSRLRAVERQGHRDDDQQALNALLDEGRRIPISTMPLVSTTTISTPITELSTDPTPPESAVPPTTTAVMVVNSRPWPSSACPWPSWAADIAPGQAGRTAPAKREDDDAGALDRHADFAGRSPRRRTDGVDPAPDAGALLNGSRRSRRLAKATQTPFGMPEKSAPSVRARKPRSEMRTGIAAAAMAVAIAQAGESDSKGRHETTACFSFTWIARR